MISEISRHPAFKIWLVLFAATALSWWIGGHGFGTGQIAAISVLLISFIKIRLVMLHFMGLRSAPIVWRCLYEGWCLIACGTLILFYLKGVPA